MSNEDETSSDESTNGGEDRSRDGAEEPADETDETDEDFFEDEHLFDEAEFEAEGWRIPRDPESVARVLKNFESLVPDILKRGAEGEEGEAAAESLRERLGDRRLPREAVSFILGQADATKREFLRILSREIRLFLEDMDFGGELTKILTSLSFEVRMEVRFIPNDQAFKPSARGRMRFKKTDRDGDDADDEEGEDESASDRSKSKASKGRRKSASGRARSDAEGSSDKDDN
ncbi:MAG: hypothetical protein ACOCV2_06455 [Persicimonas sp.]